jgi:pimeloyl-ACP methyl ester carboxylesterase
LAGALVVHCWWLPRHGINGWTREPKDKYLEAARITMSHPLDVPHGLNSPVGRVYQVDGQILLLGVGHDANTTIHLAEALAGVRYRRPKSVMINRAGPLTRYSYSEIDHCCAIFTLVDDWLDSSNTAPPHDRTRFPTVTIFDDVAAHHRLVTGLFGIRRIALVVGWSMGAQQAYQWAVSHPDMVGGFEQRFHRLTIRESEGRLVIEHGR